ncbi:MAG: hypothetical protein LBT08_07335 [Synergistaceae bacterium]|nr:hypothetical protein [Synergistaceae bacterium]
MSGLLARRVSALFIMISLIGLHIFMLWAPKRIVPDIAPVGVSSYILVTQATSEGVLSAAEQNNLRSRNGAFSAVIPIMRYVACRVDGDRFAGMEEFRFNSWNALIGQAQISCPHSDMVFLN